MLKLSYAYLASIEIFSFIVVIYILIANASGDFNILTVVGFLVLSGTMNGLLLIDIIHNIKGIIKEGKK